VLDPLAACGKPALSANVSVLPLATYSIWPPCSTRSLPSLAFIVTTPSVATTSPRVSYPETGVTVTAPTLTRMDGVLLP
jgi:hypothetical protein